MVSPYESHHRELERLKARRKSLRIMHQRVPKDLERAIERIEAELSPDRSRHYAAKVNQAQYVGIAWELRWIIGAIVLLAATAIIYVYY